MTIVTIAPATSRGVGRMVWTIRATSARRPTHRHVAAVTATATASAVAAVIRDTSTE